MPVRLVIYDVTGRAVRTLVNGAEAPGERRVFWDGRDALGARVRAGMYLCRLEAGATSLTRKLSVMR
jgi:flagellar hook assembly protein FlgD